MAFTLEFSSSRIYETLENLENIKSVIPIIVTNDGLDIATWSENKSCAIWIQLGADLFDTFTFTGEEPEYYCIFAETLKKALKRIGTEVGMESSLTEGSMLIRDTEGRKSFELKLQSAADPEGVGEKIRNKITHYIEGSDPRIMIFKQDLKEAVKDGLVLKEQTKDSTFYIDSTALIIRVEGIDTDVESIIEHNSEFEDIYENMYSLGWLKSIYEIIPNNPEVMMIFPESGTIIFRTEFEESLTFSIALAELTQNNYRSGGS